MLSCLGLVGVSLAKTRSGPYLVDVTPTLSLSAQSVEGSSSTSGGMDEEPLLAARIPSKDERSQCPDSPMFDPFTTLKSWEKAFEK